MASLLAGAKVFNKEGKREDLGQYTTVGLYFTASWCPPCRAFTPKLNKAYNDAVAANKNVQIVFISADQSQGDYNEYYKKMDFARMDFSEQQTRNKLKEKFGCRGIPYLVLLNSDGSEKTRDGRGLVDSKGANFCD